MIFLLASHSLKLNTTSHNRVFSLYTALKQKGFDVKIVYPSSSINTNWFSGQKEISETTNNEDFIFIDTKLNPVQELAFKSKIAQNYRLFYYLFYILHYLVYQRDVYYTNNSLCRALKFNGITEKDVLIVTSPPFGLFYEAFLVKKDTKCKLVLDYRDPWTYGYFPVGRTRLFSFLSKKLERQRENAIINSADYISVVYKNIKDSFPKKVKHKTSVISNGANRDFINKDLIEKSPKKFQIIYLGTIYDEQLREETFFKSLSDFLACNKIEDKEFTVSFIGSLKFNKLIKVIEKYKLEQYIEITERLSTEKALEMSYSASAFLHLRYSKLSQLTTSKHADYLALQKPILLPVSDNGVIAESIKENNAGYVCHNYDECYSALQQLWDKHKRGESFKIPRSEEFLYSISREHEAQKLVEIVQKLLNT